MEQRHGVVDGSGSHCVQASLSAASGPAAATPQWNEVLKSVKFLVIPDLDFFFIFYIQIYDVILYCEDTAVVMETGAFTLLTKLQGEYSCDMNLPPLICPFQT